VSARDLLSIGRTPGDITPAGVRANIEVTLRYLSAWLSGTGAVAINDLMEDAATAEISRGQLWQWLHHGRVSRREVDAVVEEVTAQLSALPRMDAVRSIFDAVALGPDFPDFLTLIAYESLD
jgi:malate synthase